MQQTFEGILHLRIFLNISTQSTYVYARCKCFYGHIKTHMILCALPCFCVVCVFALHGIYFFKTLPMLSNNRHTDKKHACTYTLTHTNRSASALICSNASSAHARSQTCTRLPVTKRRWVYPSLPVHFLEIMTAISSSQWLMTGRTNC